MKESKTVLISLFCAALLLAALPQTAKAVIVSDRTTIQLKNPVAIPGRVLSPGTYVMKLVSPVSSPGLVGVYRANLTHPVALLQTIPDYRARTTSRNVFVLSKGTSGNPAALQAWFSPGKQHGVQFIYPPASAHLSTRPHRRS